MMVEVRREEQLLESLNGAANQVEKTVGECSGLMSRSDSREDLFEEESKTNKQSKSIVSKFLGGIRDTASKIIRSPKAVEYEEQYMLCAESDMARVERDRALQEMANSRDAMGDLNMLSELHGDPLIEIMLESRAISLETKVQAAEIEYEKKMRDMSNQLQTEVMKREKQRRAYEQKIQDLQAQVASLTSLNESLVAQNQELMAATNANKSSSESPPASLDASVNPPAPSSQSLNPDQVERYSRQLLLSNGFGVSGQLKLLNSRVLIIGAGGIGSTVLLYLAASGVGQISVMDFDSVEMSNLHRQVIHKNEKVGLNKAISAVETLRDLNPTIKYNPISEALSFENALETVSNHDCIIDASDNPQTRFLINDACVLAGKPLISGSAVGTEGQLTVYNHAGGPCYRCLYPNPTATTNCKNCADDGVLGPVPGLIGILQALETLKVLTGNGTTMHGHMLMYDSLRCSFMRVKKPPRSQSCPVCGTSPSIRSLDDCKAALEGRARGPNTSQQCIIPSISHDLNISCLDYQRIRQNGEPHILIDVRETRQFEMCHLDNAVNIPLSQLSENLNQIEDLCQGSKPVFCICRRGIFSVEATNMIHKELSERNIESVKNISGGLSAWRREVDPSFPKY